ncbi:hypothetical protein BsWGS_12213 [Bradybaena similaris]
MEFASKYILFSEKDEYETISDEELEHGMRVSDSESDEDGQVESTADHRSVSKKKKLHHWKKEGRKSGERHLALPRLQLCDTDSAIVAKKGQHRRADTNIVSVSFNTLLLPSNMHAGEPVICVNCHAVLSHISRVDMTSKVWQCEFCSAAAEVDIEPEEIPRSEDVTFLLEPAMTTSTSTFSGVDQSLVVFCVDVSGSMCVTTEVSGKLKLRGTSQLKRLQSFNEDHDNQYLPSQFHRDVTYISRLQAMQAAVDHQLDQMSCSHPNRRVALITFNNEVTIVGDGTQEQTVVAGDKLTNEEQLSKIGSEAALPKDIKTCRRVLGEKVYSLLEGGATALGPALVVAVNMAAHHPGSKVILCTDGKANIGLGKLEDSAEEQTALEFYSKVAQSALEKGVTLSVITIGGTDCKLVHLGMLADRTGGQVNTVDPLKLTEEFSNIIADPIIATRVKATFILHKELYVIDENDVSSKLCKGERTVGNVQSSTTITFEFTRRHHPEDMQTSGQGQAAAEYPGSKVAAANSSLPVTDNSSLPVTDNSSLPVTDNSSLPVTDFPFQLQIEYTDTEGNRALRVITRTMPATTDRKVSEENANIEVLGVHAAKKSAELALQGQFSKSRSVALMNQRLAWRHSHSTAASDFDRKKYKAIYSQIQLMENTVHNQMKQEIQHFGHTRSDSEPSDDEADQCDGSNPVRHILPEATLQSHSKPSRCTKGNIPSKFKMLHSKRSSDMDDGMANMMYRFRSVGATDMNSLAITDGTSTSGSIKESSKKQTEKFKKQTEKSKKHTEKSEKQTEKSEKQTEKSEKQI